VLQRALAAAGFDHHVVPARRHDGTDALPSFVLVRVARLHGDLRCTHLLGRRGHEDTDGARVFGFVGLPVMPEPERRLAGV